MDGFGSAESAEAIMARLARRGMASQANTAYSIQSVIGNGAYGTVYRALDRRNNNRVVALKEVKVQSTDEGVPLSTLREISTLKQLDSYDHPNIVKLFDIYPSGSESILETKITLVFEFVDQDLSAFLEKARAPLSDSLIREMSRQMLSGLDFLHTNRICHRDLKPQNILVSKQNVLKLADFGLSRSYACHAALTSVVVTLWYRSPEVLLQSQYATPVDVWSLGCIFGELYLRKALFCGQSEIDQLHKIFDIMGTPEPWEWPTDVVIPITSFPKKSRRPLSDVIPGISPQGQKLLEQMLVFVPDDRISASEALKHPYFIGGPVESEPEPSDESFTETEVYTTDEESDIGERGQNLTASRVLDISETSDEVELSLENVMPQTPIRSAETPPSRNEPNILRHSGEKKRRSNEKRESNEKAQIVPPEVLTTPNVKFLDESSVWLEQGRDFVDGKCEKSGNGSSSFSGGGGSGSDEINHSASDSLLETGLVVEIGTQNSEPGEEVGLTNIDQLIEAARQTDELSTNESEVLSSTNQVQDLAVQSENVRGSPDEIDAVNSLLNFSAGLPVACSENKTSNNSGVPAVDDELDLVDGELSVGNRRGLEVFCVVPPTDGTIMTTSSPVANRNASNDHVTPPPSNHIIGFSDDSEKIFDDENPNSFSLEMDDNSNIVVTDRKRKYSTDDVCCQQAKRRKV